MDPVTLGIVLSASSVVVAAVAAFFAWRSVHHAKEANGLSRKALRLSESMVPHPDIRIVGDPSSLRYVTGPFGDPSAYPAMRVEIRNSGGSTAWDLEVKCSNYQRGERVVQTRWQLAPTEDEWSVEIPAVSVNVRQVAGRQVAVRESDDATVHPYTVTVSWRETERDERHEKTWNYPQDA